MKWVPFGATPPLAGRRVIERAVAKVRAVREAVGPEVELMVDGHGRLSPAVAVRMAEELAPFGLMFFEEPCLPANGPALARIAAKSPIPIAAGERHYTRWGFRELLEARAVAVVQPDIIQTGGLFEARKIAALAEMHFVSIAPHNPWSWVNTVASLHLDADAAQLPDPGGRHRRRAWKDEFVIGRPGWMRTGSSPSRSTRAGHHARRRRRNASRRSRAGRPPSGTRTARSPTGRSSGG